MGNSSGNLDAWAAAFEAHPVAQGGFIWDWIENPLVEMAPVTDRFAPPPPPARPGPPSRLSWGLRTPRLLNPERSLGRP